MKQWSKLCKIVLTVAIASVVYATASGAFASTWYVDTNIGNDSNTGQSDTAGPDGPWATMQRAADMVTTPGDVVEVEPGTYAVTPEWGGGAVNITHGGSSGNYITYQSAVPGGANLVFNPVWEGTDYNTAGFWVSADWIHIDGFTIQEQQPLPIADAGCGINVCAAYGTANGTEGPHHVWISNNMIFNCGQAGIQTYIGDYWIIEHNTVHNCASSSPYSGSGISEGYDMAAPGDTDTSIHNIVEDNTCYDNVIYPADQGTGNNPTPYDADGEGIIIDTNQQSGYVAQTLIQDNLCYNNGGNGIQAGHSNNCIVINNTCYENCTDNHDMQVNWSRGELMQGYSYYCTWANNIGYTDSAINPHNYAIDWADGGTSAPDSVWVDNLTYDVSDPTSQSVTGDPQFVAYITSVPLTNLLAVNPLFVDPGSEFQLQTTSRAINAGTSAYGLPSTDIAGNPRVVGAAVDLGAYEHQAAAHAAPTISSLSETAGLAADTLIITGKNLAGATSVKFNGKAATSYKVNSAGTAISVVVPSNASSGPVIVTTAGGTSNAITFTYKAPAITSFTPKSGPVATVVTIIGANFTGASSVKFNGVAAASFAIKSATWATAAVPAGATPGKITLTTQGGTATSVATFYESPSIASISPKSGIVGTTVTINGKNFFGVTSVKFHGVATSSFTVLSSTSITAVVPALVTDGPLTVTTPGGNATSAESFTCEAPTVTWFSPAKGAAGAEVAITGMNISGIESIKFNGKAVGGWTRPSMLEVNTTVPIGATPGKITLTTPGGTATSARLFYEPPTITKLSETSGLAADNLTITGANFVNVSIVKFNGTPAKTYAASPAGTAITVVVPSNATSGPLTVTTPGGTSNPVKFTYKQPAKPR